MQLAGIRVREFLVLELALMLRREDFADTADRLEAAIATELPVVALTIDDRDAILSVLDDPPLGLEILRAVLLQEQRWRRSEGLSPEP